MQSFPAFFPLAGRRIVVAGEGEAAEAKARLFDGSPAELVRLTGEAALEAANYAGAALAFVAAGDEAFVEAAAAAARSAQVPVNVVDHPSLCDFQTPAIVDRDQVVAAVGTTGAAPVVASLLRAELEARITPAVGQLARLLGDRREEIRAAFPDLAQRRALFRRVLAGPAAQAIEAGDLAQAARALDEAIAARGEPSGRIVMVIAPAQADHLSLRAARALNVADGVFVGDGAQTIVASHARRDAERLPAADPKDLVARTAQGLSTVIVATEVDRRLLEALSGLGIDVEILAPAP